jgi:hypothetical protein
MSSRTATRHLLAGNLPAATLLAAIRAYEAAGLDVDVPARCAALSITDTGLVHLLALAGVGTGEIAALYAQGRLPSRRALIGMAALRGRTVPVVKGKRKRAVVLTRDAIHSPTA